MLVTSDDRDGSDVRVRARGYVVIDDDRTSSVLDKLLPPRLEQLQRLTGLPIVLAGTTRGTGSGQQLQLHHLRGTVGDSLNGVVLAEGQGLGGAVVVRGTPCRVDDYASTDAITHEYDRIIVGEEGITSMFGVPLTVRGVVRGVMYGATRGSLTLGDVALRSTSAMAASVSRELGTLLAREAGDAEGEVPADRSAAVVELARIAATVGDPRLRRRLARIHRVLSVEPDPGARDVPAPSPLSPRELDVLRLAATGRSNREIAPALGLRPETVKAYLRSTMRKLGVGNRTEAAHAARAVGIL